MHPASAHLRRRSRRHRRLALACTAFGLLAVVAACTPERGDTDSADGTVVSTLAIPVVTAPPERRTPFCQIMLELDAGLPADPTIDVTDEVLAAYREALPVAPPEIATELEAIIVGLETGTDPTLPAGTVDVGDLGDLGDGAAADDTTDESTDDPTSDGAAPSSTAGSAGAATPDTFVPPTATAATVPSSTLEPPTPEEAFAEEGYVPDDDPAVRLAEYVDFACRDNLNNPGPPATQPSATPVPTTGG